MSRGRSKKSEIRRVVVYARVSTVEQAERDLSIPAQLDALRKYCKEPSRKYEIVDEYIEPGASGTDDNRKVFRRMLEDVLAPSAKVDAVLVYQTSRFMRNAGKARALKDALRRSGIRVIATCQETSDDPMGQFIEGIFELVDQYESDVNGMRTAAAMRENAKQGYYNGSQAPYGYKAEKIIVNGREKRKLVPDPTEVPNHNEVFRAYVGSTGAKATAVLMNQRGLRYRDGVMWDKDKVLRVIDEDAAVGTYHWGKTDATTGMLNDREDWVPIPVTPIVDRELFDMAQHLREKRDPRRNPGRTPSSPMLLAGLVHCGQCGASYQLETSGKNAEGGVYEYRYYNCRSHLRVGKAKCKGFRIRSTVLEQAILEHIADRLFTHERCRQILEDVVEEAGLLRKKTADHRRQIQRELEDIAKRLRRWTEAFETGDPSADLGAERIPELKAKRTELQQTLAKIVPLRTPPPYLYSEPSIQKFQASLRKIFLSNDATLTKNYLRFLVEKIVVTGAKVQMVTRSAAVVRMMAGANGGAALAADRDPSVSPSFEVGWLPIWDSNCRPSDWHRRHLPPRQAACHLLCGLVALLPSGCLRQLNRAVQRERSPLPDRQRERHEGALEHERRQAMSRLPGHVLVSSGDRLEHGVRRVRRCHVRCHGPDDLS